MQPRQLIRRCLKQCFPYFNVHFEIQPAAVIRVGWYAEEAVEYAREQVAKQSRLKQKRLFSRRRNKSDNLAIKRRF